MFEIPLRYRDDPNIRFLDPDEIDISAVTPDEVASFAIQNINRRIGGAGNSLDEILEFIFRETKPLFPCNRLGLAFLSDDNDRVNAYSAVADFEPVLLKTGYSEDLQGSSLEYILRSGKTRIIHDLALYLEKFPDSRSSAILVREGIRSSLTCPLTVDGRIVGLFFRSSILSNVYTSVHVGLHHAIAERLSQVVEKTYRIEKLAEANRNYSEMLGFVSHEIKNPLASTIMEANLILENYSGEVDPRIRKRIERIVTRSEGLLALVRDYLDLARLESRLQKIENVQKIDMPRGILQPAVELHQTDAELKKMTLHFETPSDDFLVEGDPDLLRIVVSNLISNAIKYGYEGTTIRLNLNMTGNSIVFSIVNDGPGFPPAQIPNLFRKFSRLQTPELIRQKGTGLGLFICWKIVKLHRGRISADSSEGFWAKFTVELPRKVIG